LEREPIFSNFYEKGGLQYIYGIWLDSAKKLLNNRIKDGIQPMHATKTGPSGSGKTETIRYLLSHFQHVGIARPLSSREDKRADESNRPFDYIFATEQEQKLLEKHNVCTLGHLYGDDGVLGGNNKNNYYSYLLDNSMNLDDIPELRDGLRPELKKELEESQSINELITKGKIVYYMMSGINHALVGEQFEQTINHEIITNLAELLKFHENRDTSHREGNACIDNKDNYEQRERRDKAGPSTSSPNRHHTDGPWDEMDKRVGDIAEADFSYDKLFIQLGFPRTNEEFYQGIINHLTKKVLSATPELGISDVEEISKHYANGGEQINFSIKGFTLEIVDVQKVKDTNTYSVVINVPEMLDNEDYVIQSRDSRIDPHTDALKELDKLVDTTLGGAVLQKKRGLAQPETEQDSRMYYETSTGLETPEKGDYDVYMVVGPQLVIGYDHKEEDEVLKELPTLRLHTLVQKTD